MHSTNSIMKSRSVMTNSKLILLERLKRELADWLMLITLVIIRRKIKKENKMKKTMTKKEQPIQ